VLANGTNVSITDATDINFGSTTAGNLTVNAGGAITQTAGAIAVFRHRQLYGKR
jgi:spore coat protein U-like protein